MIFAGIIIAIAIAVGAGYLMSTDQKPSWTVYSTSGTRVGDPGHNLVGEGWTGENSGDSIAAAEPEEPSS
jgi:hypothetical protein